LAQLDANRDAGHLGPLPAADDPIIQWNPPERLAPVGCWLVILIHGRPHYAFRTAYIESKSRDMAYQLDNGLTVTGRFLWTTP
jgi:hypothetical protein